MTEKQPRTYSGQVSGLRWEAEECPDATGLDSLKGLAGGGAVGWLGAVLMGAAPQLRMLMALAGATAGIFATRYHLNVDWDPDQLRDGPDGPPPPSTDAPSEPFEGPQPL